MHVCSQIKPNFAEDSSQRTVLKLGYLECRCSITALQYVQCLRCYASIILYEVHTCILDLFSPLPSKGLKLFPMPAGIFSIQLK